MSISAVSPSAQSAAMQQTQSVKPRDADGDHDGTPAASAHEAQAPKLAESGSVGTLVHAVA